MLNRRACWVRGHFLLVKGQCLLWLAGTEVQHLSLATCREKVSIPSSLEEKGLEM